MSGWGRCSAARTGPGIRPPAGRRPAHPQRNPHEVPLPP
jgi:hypothetical protein